jgi:signal transduction histidine kinase/CheY-like chemotaxis protein
MTAKSRLNGRPRAAAAPAPRKSAHQAAPKAPIDWQRRCVELYDQAPLAYVTLDGQGLIQSLNLPATALLGVDRLHALGLPFRMFVAPADRGALSAHLSQFKKAGSAVSDLVLENRRSGSLSARLASRTTEEGPGLCFTAISDVTVERRSEAERRALEQAERTAREANKAKDDFISMLSHELRTPLTPLLAAVSSLTSGRLSRTEMMELGQIFQRNVTAEVRLIDDLLDVTRIENHKLRLQRQTIDLHEIARQALEMFDGECRARHLELLVGLDATNHHVDGDSARLGQLFSNLFKNAIKYTPDGGRIGLRSWNQGQAIVVEVSDSGEGIGEAVLPRIFERFEQGRDPSTSGGGLGLGLAICRGIVELHGGRISAHSPGRDRGARFLVELKTVAGPTPAPPLSPTHPPASRAPQGRMLRILLIEDEPDVALALAILLGLEGFEVETVATAGEALAVDLDKINIVVSDLQLPDLDGRTLLGRLRAKRPVPAIALSGYGTEADIRASLEAGFHLHLVKPVELETLVSAIERALAAAEPLAER